MCVCFCAVVMSCDHCKWWCNFSVALQRRTCHSVAFNCARVYVCVCLLCPLHITGMGNQWVQLFYVYLQQGWMLHVTSGNVVMVLCISLSQASSILLLLGFWAASLPKVMSSVDIEGRFLTHKLPACTVSLLYCSTFWKPALILPLRVSNPNLNLLFIALVCLKNRTPCSLSNKAWNVSLEMWYDVAIYKADVAPSNWNASVMKKVYVYSFGIVTCILPVNTFKISKG